MLTLKLRIQVRFIGSGNISQPIPVRGDEAPRSAMRILKSMVNAGSKLENLDAVDAFNNAPYALCC